MKSRFDEGICPCCRHPTEREWGVGYRPNGQNPIMWFCRKETCQQLGPKVYAMDDGHYQEIVGKAIWEGGKAGGEYLATIGITDLGALDKNQYFSFLEICHTTTENRLRELIDEYAAVTGCGENG